MIITETEKSEVVFSNLFFRHYPALSEEIGKIICSYHKGLGAVFNTNDYWVRDFMPIQIDKDVFVKFIYNPDYLQGQKKYITDVDKVLTRSPIYQNYKFINVPLVVDGGNMVFCRRRMSPYGLISYVVMTEKVLVENPQYSKEQIEELFKSTFGHIVIVWLPWDREDTFGHTDGIVKFIGSSQFGRPNVLVNLELYDDDIANQMYESLAKYFKVEELKLSEYEELSWAYINSLQTQDFIIVPGIGNEVTDAEALDQYRKLFPEYKDNIYQVQMRDFIKENGGALNCLTWTIRQEDSQEGYSKTSLKKSIDWIEQKPGVLGVDILDKEKSTETSYVIREGVTGIPNRAFANITSFTSIHIPDSVTSIGSHAFDGCTSLKVIVIPNSVKYVGLGAFENCVSLISVKLPDNIKEIEMETFKGCSSIERIDISDSVTDISFSVFEGCINIKEPVGNKHLFARLPSNHQGGFTIPDGVKKIVWEAFNNCESLTEIVIPDSVKEIKPYSFQKCKMIKKPIFNKYLFAYMPDAHGSFTIPEGIREICGAAFSLNHLTRVELPQSLESIRSYAFAGCYSLSDITIPDSVTTIEDAAFLDCKKLSNITVSQNNTSYISVDGVVFTKDMTKLVSYPAAKEDESYVIPSNTIVLGNGSINECKKLKRIEIHENVKEIGKYCFGGSLRELHIKQKNPSYIICDFLGPLVDKITLFVPKESILEYRKHREFSKFKEILGE